MSDIATSQDTQKLQFLGSELEFVENSSETEIFIYQNKNELNRINIGFFEKNEVNDGEDAKNWNLISKTEHKLVIQNSSKIFYQIANNSSDFKILCDDNSPKSLIYFKNNKTGIDFYIYAENSTAEIENEILLDVGVTDTLTKTIGVCLTGKLLLNDDLRENLRPYISEKIYEKPESPEIYREYKLKTLKFLSPAEREKFKHINGL